jgi:hypothetical protein
MFKTLFCRCQVFVLLFFSLLSQAQKIGVNNTNPQVSLDVKGAVAIRPETFSQAVAPITTFNITNVSYFKFSSNQANPVQRLINLTPGKNGQQLIIEFTGEGAARMLSGSGLSNGGKLLLASNMTFDEPSLIALVYEGTNWKELYRQETLRAQDALDSTLFTTPGAFTFTVPPGITKLTLTLLGAGGWGGGATSNPLGQGGRGGLVSGEITVTEGETLDVIVGTGGKSGVRAGISAIKRGATFLGLAAGGGNGSRNGGFGGRAGQTGDDGINGTSIHTLGTPGGGATTIAGGSAGTQGTQGDDGTAGTALTGGINLANNSGDGWGGHGWFGGGGSGTYDFLGSADGPYANGGGGGGSNYTVGLGGTILNNGNGSLGGQGNVAGTGGVVKIFW